MQELRPQVTDVLMTGSVALPLLKHMGRAATYMNASARFQAKFTVLAVLPHRATSGSALSALERLLAVVQLRARHVLLLADAHQADFDAHGGLWGLARSVRAETSLSIACMESSVRAALDLTSHSTEPEAVERLGVRLVPRLKSAQLSSHDAVRLHFHARGAIGNLFIQPLDIIQTVAPGEVLLRVRAVGLNFRDVLNVLGEYPGDPGPPGGDVAGWIVTESEPYQPGYQSRSAALGIGYAPLASTAIAREPFTTLKPRGMSFEQASTLPVTWSTTHLVMMRARLYASGSAIVHAAAGGVGLKAIEYLSWLSTSAVSTAGHPQKHARLRSVDTQLQSCSSRDGAAFAFGAAQLLHASREHAVLNSLSVDFIVTSFAFLDEKGAFQELGKRDVWAAERQVAATTSVAYDTVALDNDMSENPSHISKHLHILAARAAVGAVHSVPLVSYEMETQYELAFRALQSGAHCGKIIMRVSASKVLVGPDQIVTGGTGGLGLLTGRWLAQRGTRRLILVSRGAVIAFETAREWKALQETATSTVVVRCDVAQRKDVHSLNATVRSACGLWHAAGCIADAVLDHQDSSALAFVYAPKVFGARNLHAATIGRDVAVCTLFSSVAALFGGAGQVNYSAANACLDALSTGRCSRGLPSVSVQWGAWADVGMATRGAASVRAAAMAAELGFGRISLSQGLTALETATRPRSHAVLGVVPIVWSRFLEDVAPTPAFLLEFAPKQPSKGTALRRCPSTHVVCHSLASVLDIVKRTAGHPVDADAPLMEAGLDSLGAVELRNRLHNVADTTLTLPSTLVFDHPTARQLASVISTGLCVPLSVTTHPSSQCSAAVVTSVTAADICGVSGVLPAGAKWESSLVLCGANSIAQVPADRWQLHEHADATNAITNRMRHVGFISGAELVDNAAFEISPTECVSMDPCQRLMLESAYTASHEAAIDRGALAGSLTGVFLGFVGTEFVRVLASIPAGGSVYAATSASASIASGRVSYALGLHGPCVTYDTACSAALVASHAGLNALRRGECPSGLAVGTMLMLTPFTATSFAIAGMTSERGRSHTFDARADGYARGEACGALMLRSGLQHLAKGRLLGSAVRQDGRSASLTAPNGLAQSSLLTAGLINASVSSLSMTLHEAHGTGTALGDPIESSSLVAALVARSSRATRSMVLSGVKASVGHAEPAAGMAGLLNLAVGLRRDRAAPNAQLRILNRHVYETLSDVSSTLAAEPCKLSSSPPLQTQGGVSSFGYSGTVANVVLGCEHATSPGAQTMLSSYQTSLLVYRRRAYRWISRFLPGLSPEAAVAPPQLDVREHLTALVRGMSWSDQLDSTVPLIDLGIDSLAWTDFAAELRQLLPSGVESLPSITDLYSMSLEDLFGYVEARRNASSSRQSQDRIHAPAPELVKNHALAAERRPSTNAVTITESPKVP